MFNTFSTFLRLSLCMLFSVSLHGGVAFYDWAVRPAEPSLAIAPVVVSFVPAAEMTSPNVQEILQPPPELVAAAKKPHVRDIEPAALAPKATPLPNQSVSGKALPEKAATPVVAEERETTTSSAEMVCVTPQETTLENLSELFADSPPEVASADVTAAQAEVQDSASQTVEKGLRDSVALAAYKSTLIEAIPKYRSNPLPEYPYLARQKRWQGVVWLLVDVNAEGLVDDLRVEQSCGHRVLDRAASKTVRRWQFSPAKRAGLPISSQARIPVRFRLEDG